MTPHSSKEEPVSARGHRTIASAVNGVDQLQKRVEEFKAERDWAFYLLDKTAELNAKLARELKEAVDDADRLRNQLEEADFEIESLRYAAVRVEELEAELEEKGN